MILFLFFFHFEAHSLLYLFPTKSQNLGKKFWDFVGKKQHFSSCWRSSLFKLFSCHSVTIFGADFFYFYFEAHSLLYLLPAKFQNLEKKFWDFVKRHSFSICWRSSLFKLVSCRLVTTLEADFFFFWSFWGLQSVLSPPHKISIFFPTKKRCCEVGPCRPHNLRLFSPLLTPLFHEYAHGVFGELLYAISEFRDTDLARLFIKPEFCQCPLRRSCQLQLFWYQQQTVCFCCISL